MTDADSPTCVRRRIHLRSLSDVTPASRALAARARSHSERPRASPQPSPARAPLAPPRARSERSSPVASLLALDAPTAPAAPSAPPTPPHAAPVLGNPWRKMSEHDLDLRSRPSPRSHDPWVRNSSLRPLARDETGGVSSEPETGRGREGAGVKRGKLERKAAVCESCGGASCECWRAEAAGARTARGSSLCTCERSPRVSPARLLPRVPARALSDDEERPRRLYKSASQRVVCASIDGDVPRKAADPLLETTC